MTITIQTEGRRSYLLGNTWPIKDQLRAAGCKWDPDRKAWWSGKRDVVERIAAAAAAVDETQDTPRQAETLADNQAIAGKAKYKGKTYLLVWSGETKRGPAAKLAFSDGSKTFWASLSEVEVTKRYESRENYRAGRMEGMTFGRLRQLQEEWRRKSPEERQGIKSGQHAESCTCYSCYQQEIEALDDQDCFSESQRVEAMGYHAWRASK